MNAIDKLRRKLAQLIHNPDAKVRKRSPRQIMADAAKEAGLNKVRGPVSGKVYYE